MVIVDGLAHIRMRMYAGWWGAVKLGLKRGYSEGIEARSVHLFAQVLTCVVRDADSRPCA
jgi:hypothetical protein